MKIAYNLLIVLDVDPDGDEAGREWRELTAQLREAAFDLTREGAPEPGEARCLRRTEDVTVYLSAVDLTPAEPHTIVPDPWTSPDAAAAAQPPPF